MASKNQDPGVAIRARKFWSPDGGLSSWGSPMKNRAASAPQPRMRVAAVQFESQPGDKEANFRVMEKFIRQAARRGVELIVFPECCLTGYWFLRNLNPTQLGAL